MAGQLVYIDGNRDSVITYHGYNWSTDYLTPTPVQARNAGSLVVTGQPTTVYMYIDDVVHGQTITIINQSATNAVGLLYDNYTPGISTIWVPTAPINAFLISPQNAFMGVFYVTTNVGIFASI